jgi:hypothetical protein
MRRTSVLLAAIFTAVLCINGSLSAAAYSGGGGVLGNPYKISTLGNWQTLTTTPTDWDKHFILTTNLEFGGLTISPVGNSSTQFTGVFDGKGHVIRNAVINQPSGDNVGIFGSVGEQGGPIHNFGVEQVQVIGRWSVGGLVGENCGLITACYATGSVYGNETVGGLVGVNRGEGQISNCYSTCSSVSGSNFGGGLAGMSDGQVDFCYSSGVVSGTGYTIGGLVGAHDSGGPTSNFCFWDIQTSGLTTSRDGFGLLTTAMKNAQTFLRSFWDFKGEMANGTNDYWTMPAGGGYPILAWQVDTSSAPTNDEMSDATAITAGSSLSGISAGATGVDLTANGYNDWADVWYYFDCASSGNFTITVQGANFDTTLAVFDEVQREIIFNDDFFGGKSAVILKAKSGKRYYIRVSGDDGSTGNFTISVQQGAVQAIQGDLNYDGKVNLIDFSAMAQNWMTGE